MLLSVLLKNTNFCLKRPINKSKQQRVHDHRYPSTDPSFGSKVIEVIGFQRCVQTHYLNIRDNPLFVSHFLIKFAITFIIFNIHVVTI